MKVVLAGQGADEPHGGYGRHQAAALLRPLRLVPAAAGDARPPRSPARSRAPPAPAALAHLLGGRGDAERLLRLVEITDAPVRTRAARRRRRRTAEHERLAPARASARRTSPDRGLLEQALYLDTHMFLPDGILLCNDKMSMAAGLELRVPFLDLELMRFVERIPATRAGAARARPSGSTGMAMERLLPAARSRTARSTASPPPTTTGCAPRSARRSSAATRPARRSPS